MPDINKHEVDIENLFKQNELDLNSIKQLYKRIEELGEKISQIKVIDNTLANKLKKEYESLKKIIIDENVQVELNNKIEETKTELNEVSSQMEHKASKSCKELGLVPNSEINAYSNLKKIIEALNDNKNIVVDDIYYIGGEVSTSNVSISGFGKLIVVDNVTTITVVNSLHVKDVTINLKSGVERNSNTPLFVSNNNLEFVKFENVKSDKYIFMFRLNNSTQNIIKINNLDILNCSFENPQLLFHLYKVDCNQINVKGNKIHNNETVPFNFNTVNCPIVNIDGNRIINDIDFWNNFKSTYFSMFILSGDGTCHYTNNEVNGLKTRQDGMAVYDAYLSYTKVYWTNNIWQDNVNVSSNNTFNVLFYGKSADISNSVGIRNVVSNSYKITSELLNTLTDIEKSNVQLSIYRFQFPVDSFIFKNNTIDTGELKLRGNLGDQFFDNFIFENNNIKGNFNYDMFRIKASNINSYTSICENKFISTGETPIVFFYNVGSATESNMVGKLLFNNNFIQINYTNFITSVAIKDFEINGNTIVNTNTSIWEGALVKNSIINNIIGINNVLKGEYAVSDIGTGTEFNKMYLELNKVVNPLLSKTAMFQLPNDSEGYIKIEETKLTGNTIFELPYVLDGANITYVKDGTQVTELFDNNKKPYTDKNYLTFAYSTRTLNYVFTSGIDYNLKIKYMIN